MTRSQRVDYDDDLKTVVVRTVRETSYEDKLKKKIRTSGCAVGTVFGDMMEGLEDIRLPQVSVRTSWLYDLAAKINRTPSLYLEAGAIHGTVLCREKPLIGLYGGCGPPQCRRQDRGLDAFPRVKALQTRYFIRPGV